MSKWPIVRIGDVLKRADRFEPKDEVTEYRFAGTYSFARGVFAGERKPGSSFSLPKIQRIHEGDFVYCKIMAWEGAFGLVPKEADNCVMSGAFVVYEPKRESIEPEFLKLFFQVPHHWTEIGQQSTGTNVRRRSLHPDQFEASPIPFPPLPEQRRIVARIESLAAMAEEARDLQYEAIKEAEALFNASLGCMFESCAKKYSQRAIKSFSTVKGGKRLPAGERLSDEPTLFPYIRVADMKDHFVSLAEIKYVPDRLHSGISRYIINKNDVYVTIAGTIGYPGTIPEELDGANLTENAARLVFDQPESIDKRFVVYQLRSPQVQERFRQKQTVAAQPKLALHRIASTEIPLPPIAEQCRIVAYLDGLQTKVDALKKLQAETAAELASLLPSILDKAFKGEL